MKKLIFTICILTSVLATAELFDAQTEEVKVILTSSDQTRYNYCITGTMTCRTLVLLRSKATGQPADMFFNNFFSSERTVGLSGYFLKNSDNTFRSYTDTVFDGKTIVDTINDWDKNIEITFDSDGFPTAHNLNLKTLGTTKFSIAELSFNQNESKITGTRYDTADPTFSEKVEIVYKRVLN